MSKVIGSIIDCYDDVNFVNHVYAKSRYGDELIEPSDLTKVADRDFAVKITEGRNTFRKFPVYNPTITKVSCAYFLDNKDSLPEGVEKTAGFNLKEACARYNLGIPSDLQSYGPAQFNVVLEEDKRMPELRRVDELAKTAAQLLVNQFSRMTPEDRVASAEELSKVAAIADQRIWDYVPKAEYGPHFKKGIAERWEMLKSASDDQDPLWASYKYLISQTYRTSTPLEFSVELAQFDKLAGFRDRYKDGFSDPYYICFAGFPTPAAELEKEAALNAELTHPYLPRNANCTEEMSKAASVESHVAGLREQFPKGTDQYRQALAVTLSDDDKARWGENYSTARDVYFK